MKVLRHPDLRAAGAIVRGGGVLVYPTDTVWGLGGDATNPAVAERVCLAKGKKKGENLIWLLPSVTAVEKYCGAVSPEERQLLGKKRTTVIIRGQAVRVVKSGWLNKLLRACGVPLISTSANQHGKPPITSWRQAESVFGDTVTAVIRGRKIYRNVPSAVVAVENHETKVIRASGRISIR